MRVRLRSFRRPGREPWINFRSNPPSPAPLGCSSLLPSLARLRFCSSICFRSLSRSSPSDAAPTGTSSSRSMLDPAAEDAPMNELARFLLRKLSRSFPKPWRSAASSSEEEKSSSDDMSASAIKPSCASNVSRTSRFTCSEYCAVKYRAPRANLVSWLSNPFAAAWEDFLRTSSTRFHRPSFSISSSGTPNFMRISFAFSCESLRRSADVPVTDALLWRILGRFSSLEICLRRT
mmetsp:Transcript_6585/g.18606  ORF Transcript_6585/g.18606 Transcript_6585/m.18606 type:complete len:234 (-) Transcript_6585:934-1635(-)